MARKEVGDHSANRGRRFTDETTGPTSVIAERMILRGEAKGTGNLELQGVLEGTCVIGGMLIVRPGGRLIGSVEANDVLVEGEDSAWWHGRARDVQATTKRPIRRIRIPRETAVYGREEELKQLRGLYEQAKAGDGQVVPVSVALMAGMAEGDMEIVFGTFLFSGSVIMNWFSWNYLNKQDKRHAPKETH